MYEALLRPPTSLARCVYIECCLINEGVGGVNFADTKLWRWTDELEKVRSYLPCNSASLATSLPKAMEFESVGTEFADNRKG
jgi:hypothetical protein